MDTRSDNLLDLFETELRSGNAPSIEAYLERSEEQSRPRILRELISLEIYYGLKDGRLRDLDCSIGPGHFQTGHHSQEAAQ